MKTILLGILFGLSSTVISLAGDARPAVLATDEAQLPVEKHPWGSLKWLSNSKLTPGTLQTVGIAETLPGKKNPVHFHPNCEEVLYVLSGQGKHMSEGHTIDLKPGVTLCIPAGVKHNMINTGTEPIRCLISFSSADRKTVFLNEDGKK